MKRLMLGGLLLTSLALGGCVGFCSAAPGKGEVSFYVSDVWSGAPVADVIIRGGGSSSYVSCEMPDAQNHKLCAYYLLENLPGHYVVEVSAPGYKPTKFPVDVKESDDQHVAVEIYPN